ncbi:YihY/virulence factor BrkB family protein [Oceanibium sediminis]|uniref:YihY/virulence factor BrkB family protein n=1 Tax=Oceanibium sediminis TaxID=2026339 RepID=UPI000DD2D4A3|nr:YihY/virulence factor BrkB family protein [Oceanibium sediminis]
MINLLNPYLTVGRMVYRRPRYRLHDWWRVLVKVGVGIGEKRLSLMSAGVAFFAMLALFPAIGATISLFGIIANPIAVQQNMELLEPIIPDQVYALINQQVSSVVFAPPQALGLASGASLLLATFSARAGVNAMLLGLTAITRDTGQRGYFLNLVVAYSLTLLLIMVTLLSVGTVVILPTVLSYFPLGGWTERLVDALRWGTALFAVVIGIGALYRFGPVRPARRMPMFTLGNMVASVLWVLVSLAFSLYLGNFANYNQVYGSLGAVVALLMWFYLSAFVVLLGAELNIEMEARAEELIRRRNPDLDRLID